VFARKTRRQAKLKYKLVETVVGRVLFNQSVPEETGFVDELLTKKKLQGIIADVYKMLVLRKRLSSLMILRNLVSKWHTGGLSMGLERCEDPG
jgi:DNA-directed RNA polymerase subunit beta'